jgi:hypothetical protein
LYIEKDTTVLTFYTFNHHTRESANGTQIDYDSREREERLAIKVPTSKIIALGVYLPDVPRLLTERSRLMIHEADTLVPVEKMKKLLQPIPRTQFSLFLDKKDYAQNEKMIISGSLFDASNERGIPNADIWLMMDKRPITGINTVADGSYSYELSTESFSPGDHRIEMLYPDGEVSKYISFTIGGS